MAIKFLCIFLMVGSFVVFGNTSLNSVHAGDKITICHIPPGNPANKHTITISQSALQAHLAHGDTIGACGGGLPQ